jgi:hypothetical protein
MTVLHYGYVLVVTIHVARDWLPAYITAASTIALPSLPPKMAVPLITTLTIGSKSYSIAKAGELSCATEMRPRPVSAAQTTETPKGGPRVCSAPQAW